MKDHSRDDGIKRLEVTLLHCYSYSSHIQPLLSFPSASSPFHLLAYCIFLFFFFACSRSADLIFSAAAGGRKRCLVYGSTSAPHKLLEIFYSPILLWLSIVAAFFFFLFFFLVSHGNGSKCLARAWRMSLPHTANRTPPFLP